MRSQPRRVTPTSQHRPWRREKLAMVSWFWRLMLASDSPPWKQVPAGSFAHRQNGCPR